MSLATHITGGAALAGAANSPSGSVARADRGPFSIEGWKAAWANPSPERVAARIPLITTPDVAGYWPRTSRPVRGPNEYARRIVDLLTLIPDFRAELVEHATNGDIMFLRWVAHGTGPSGCFEAIGVDRLIVPNGYVAENLILSDHPVFAALAQHVGDLSPG
jgi:SnoaL-like polyketide cyclase